MLQKTDKNSRANLVAANVCATGQFRDFESDVVSYHGDASQVNATRVAVKASGESSTASRWHC